MSFTLVLLVFVTALIIWLPWLWRYKWRPHFAKAELKKLLQSHPEGEQLGQIMNLLSTLFRGINSSRLSQRERKRLRLKEDAYIYGEIDFLSFLLLLAKMEPKAGEVFYDLGSGAGKAVFAAALFCDLQKACGIELLPGLCKLAVSQINKAKTLVTLGDKNLTELNLRRLSAIQFINDNFLNCEISDGDLVFINATCLSYTTWAALEEKLKKLKVGSRVLVTTKKIQNRQFEILYQANELMSWGMNSVNLYKKTS